MLIDPSLIKDYEYEVPMETTLRYYQNEGVKLISFLSRFNLNGVMADDMGLGKTIQVLSFVMNEMYLMALGNCIFKKMMIIE